LEKSKGGFEGKPKAWCQTQAGQEQKQGTVPSGGKPREVKRNTTFLAGELRPAGRNTNPESILGGTEGRTQSQWIKKAPFAHRCDRKGDGSKRII